MTIVDYMIDQYGYNEPIFSHDIIRRLNIKKPDKLNEDLAKLSEEKEIAKFAKGIYFIPHPHSKLTDEELYELIEKRIQNNINCGL